MDKKDSSNMKLKDVPIEEQINLLNEIKDKKDKKLNISIDTLFNICFDVFESGVETGKKITLDVDGKLKSPKKGTVLFEGREFNKVYNEVIEKYCK